MMSSEEDVTVDSFGVLKKTKRARQRVDAGEPRNSYSSIPNFSSRPTILNSNIYGAFFAAPNHQQQQQQHFAASNGLGAGATIGGANSAAGNGSGGVYFGQVGFGPSKMLNELLRSRGVKSNSIAGDNGDAMMTIDVAAAASDAVSAISGAAYECLNNQTALNCGAGGPLNGAMGSGSPPVTDMAQHMLRNILQGVGRSKKDLYALERELREAGNINNNNNSSHNNNIDAALSVDCVNDGTGLNNNNNNNNGSHVNDNHNHNTDEDENDEVDDDDEDELDHNDNGGDQMKQDPDDIDETGCMEGNDLANGATNSLSNGNAEDTDGATDTDDRNKAQASPRHNDKLNDCSASERSVSSPESVSNNNNNNNNIKDDPDEPIKECLPAQKSEQKELKRARVENIVSCMRSSPLPVPVNGCKKRKLYHPQQHDNSVAERYAGIVDYQNVQLFSFSLLIFGDC